MGLTINDWTLYANILYSYKYMNTRNACLIQTIAVMIQ